MSAPEGSDHLVAALARVRCALRRQEGAPALLPPLAPDPASALSRLCGLFGLSAFERDLLVLCAGAEVEGDFGPLCAAANGPEGGSFPTFGLALSCLDGAHWSAIAPNAPLRRWRLIELREGASLTGGPLRIDERVLHYIIGVEDGLADAASGLEPLASDRPLVPSEARVAERVAKVWEDESPPLLRLVGAKAPALRAIAAQAAEVAGRGLQGLRASAIPAAPSEMEPFVRRVERELILTHSALAFEPSEGEGPEAALGASLLARLQGPVVVVGGGERASFDRPTVRIEASRPEPGEQASLWRERLGLGEGELHEEVLSLVGQFDVGHDEIEAAASAAARLAAGEPPARRVAAAWDVCRDQARPALEALAQRVETGAGWDDLVLPRAQIALLREVVGHVRHRAQVYEEWGFGGGSRRGLGISALFWGASGTGKTMAAEVLAHALELDLFRIDLSSMVSKYIGETEKNMRRVFDAAEESGAILLFDEADALFGKRSEVKDSHDRFANIEVGYLLQRMEAYRGLAILTTNLRDSLDAAFTRRIRFSLEFPFPDLAGRTALWRRVFPKDTPTDELDHAKMAGLNVAGGSIRNIALQAAFFAAAEECPVRMEHVLRAARFEYEKLGRPLSDAETRGWL